jgi:hypothetical protein
MIMRHLGALTAACLATTGFAAAGEVAPMSGHSIYLGDFTGVVYYTAEQDGYRVVATLASGPESMPIRFVSTLAPGQRAVISVPQGLGEPSIDVELARDGEALRVSELVAPRAAPTDDAPATALAAR